MNRAKDFGDKGVNRSRGFSLLELMIVIAVIAIIAALAVPSLISSKKAAFEVAAIAYIRTWSSAQEIYYNLHSCYANDDEQLLAAGLIGNPDPDRMGYNFSLDNPAGSRTQWWGTASPSNPGVTGDRYFFIDQSGLIRWSVGGPANVGSAPLDSSGPQN